MAGLKAHRPRSTTTRACLRYDLGMLAMRRGVLVAGLMTLGTACAAGNQQPIASTPPASPREAGPSAKPAYEEREQLVSKEDLRILERAREILSNASKWNRKDNRECRAEATTWSIYCALHDASLEVLGRYEHRRVALQEVRFAIEEVTNGRRFQHRLMDFNNLPSTTLADIHEVLAIARRRVAERLEKTSSSSR
jgi:hypothetical protein